MTNVLYTVVLFLDILVAMLIAYGIYKRKDSKEIRILLEVQLGISILLFVATSFHWVGMW